MNVKHVGTAALLGLFLAASAHAGTIGISNGGQTASLTATSAVGAMSPFPLLNLGNAGTNGLVSSSTTSFAGGTISFGTASSPPAGIYDGTTTNVAASPYTGTAVTPANYLVAEPGNAVTISFTSPQQLVNLLWGSVDTFNGLNLSFLNGSTVVGSLLVTGSDVASAAGISANGLTSAFVTVRGGAIPTYNTIVATSTTSAFEFELGYPTSTPEPATLALVAAGLAGLGMVRRRKA